jgi:hypothetical protein
MILLTPFSDPDAVLAAIKPLTDQVHVGLHRLLPTTRAYFDSQNKPVDKTLHAMLTRYQLRHYLLSKCISAENEEDLGNAPFSVRGLSNCGLVVSCVNCVFRILKWHNCELPASTSAGRFQFYQENLYSFEPNDPFPGSPVPPLNLVGAWNTDAAHDLASFSVVCPFGEVNGRVASKWWRTLQLPEDVSAALSSLEPVPPEPELNEITLKEGRVGGVPNALSRSAANVKT